MRGKRVVGARCPARWTHHSLLLFVAFFLSAVLVAARGDDEPLISSAGNGSLILATAAAGASIYANGVDLAEIARSQDQIRAAVSLQQGALNATHQDVAMLDATVRSLGDGLSLGSANVSSLRSAVASLESSLSTSKGTIAVLSLSVVAAQMDLSEARGTVSQLQSKLSTLQNSTAAAVSQQVSSQLASLNLGTGANISSNASVLTLEAVRAALCWPTAPQFRLAEVSSSVSSATSVAVADIDGDGFVDVVSASFASSSIQWHRNVRGDGTVFLQAITVTNAAMGIRSVEAADLDGDGDMDIASASGNDNVIAWYENVNGDGSSWMRRVITSTFSGALQVAIGDIDGDDDLDIVSVHTTNGNVVVHRNNGGTGTINWSTESVATESGANSVTLGDVDRDERLDIIISSGATNRVTWLRNTGEGNVLDFSSTAVNIPALVQGARATSLADMDGDGDNDIVSAGISDSNVYWHENEDGDGLTWADAKIVSDSVSEVYSFVTADVDGDGDPDVVTASQGSQVLAWHENVSGDGSLFASHTMSTSSVAVSRVRAADVDGDGDLDIVTSSSTDDTILWYDQHCRLR